MSRDDQHFRLRLPAAIREKVEQAAEINRRSMTAEILDRLQSSFEEHAIADKNAFERYAEEIAKIAALETARETLSIFRRELGARSLEKTMTWYEGLDHFNIHGPGGRRNNPYESNTGQHREWNEGFTAAADWFEKNKSNYER